MGQKSSLVCGNWLGEIFFSLTLPYSRMCTRIYIFCLKSTHTQQKATKFKEETEKQKETEEKKKKNVVIVNSICGKPNMIKYHLQICCALLTFWISPGCSYEFNIVYVQWEIKNQRNRNDL